MHKLEKLKREKLFWQKGIKKAQTRCGTLIRISKCRQESVGKGENTKQRNDTGGGSRGGKGQNTLEDTA